MCFILFTRIVLSVLLAVPSAAIRCWASIFAVPYKIVWQIVTGKFIDLAELLSGNLKESNSEPQLLFNGRVVLMSSTKRPMRKIADIIAWLETFSIFSLILAAHFPSRWHDLTPGWPMIERFANMQMSLDSQIGPVSMFRCLTFMLLALAFGVPSQNQVGVPLYLSASLGTMVFAWRPLAHATSHIVALFALRTIRPQIALSASGDQPDPKP